MQKYINKNHFIFLFNIKYIGDNMLKEQDFLEQSLNSNLFYLRTLRDFCINIQLSFYGNSEYIGRASSLAKQSQDLGRELVTYTNGIIPKDAKEYQLYYTDYTLATEKLTEELFNLNLATDITENISNLTVGTNQAPTLENIKKIEDFNKKALTIATEFVNLAEEIRKKLLNNELFSYSYPLLYDYMIRTINIYKAELVRLEEKTVKDPILVVDTEYDYNITVYEIISFLRGLINPNAARYILELNELINEEYPKLLDNYNNLPLSPENQLMLSEESLRLLRKTRILIKDMLKDLLDANLYFIIEPLAIDNFYRNTNYFLYIIDQDLNFS